MEIEINYIAILVAAIASFILGSLWYSPLMFLKMWVKAGNIDMKKKGNLSPALAMAIGFVVQLLTAFVLAHFLVLLDADTIKGAMMASFWLWLGFIATTQFGSVLWESKSVKYFAINAAHSLASMFVMAVVLTTMN